MSKEASMRSLYLKALPVLLPVALSCIGVTFARGSTASSAVRPNAQITPESCSWFSDCDPPAQCEEEYFATCHNTAHWMCKAVGE